MTEMATSLGILGLRLVFSYFMFYALLYCYYFHATCGV